jgi:hypothetical protein
VEVIDVSDPLAPAIVGLLPVPDRATGVAISGDRLYVAGYAGGVHVASLQCAPAAVDEDRTDRRARLEIGPNPTAGGAWLRFGTDRAAGVDVSVWDAAGRCVRRIDAGRLGPGAHALEWDGRDARGRSCATGLYLIRLETGGRVSSGRVLRIR